MAPGKSSIPFECKLELGIALQSLQGKIDLIYACVQDLVYSRAAPGKSGLHARGEGEREGKLGVALESLQGLRDLT